MLPGVLMHHTPLLTTLAAGFVLAFLFGALANRLRISPLVGYCLLYTSDAADD